MTLYHVCTCNNLLPHTLAEKNSPDEIRTRFSMSRLDATMNALFAEQTEELFSFTASSWREACDRFERWVELQIAIYEHEYERNTEK